MKTIAVCTFKGGVGKTTTALNIAAGLATKGVRVLAGDLDRTNVGLMKYEANVALARPGIEFRAITAGRVGRLAQSQKWDYMVLDCPPSLEREPVAALQAAQIVVVPVVPELPAVEGLATFMEVVARIKNPRLAGSNPSLQVVILPLMVDSRDREALEIEAEIREAFPDLVWATSIARAPVVSSANNARCSVLDHAPRHQAATVYRALARHAK